MNNLDLYNKYYTNRKFERTSLFKLLEGKYQVKTMLYPGSFVHVTPSFFIPRAYYVDSDRAAKKFFANREEVIELINNHKVYEQESEFYFFGQDYFKPIDIEEGSIDLLISQWAGPISQACKKYLRKGGYLLVNNSHADAGIASLDPDYRLVGVVKSNKGKYTISEKKLKEYFHPKKDIKHSIESLLNTGKGIGYTKVAESYIFEIGTFL